MANCGKHAYMIMVHNEWRIFKLVMEMLDDERNDLYIHVDLKVKESDIPYDICNVTKKSKVYMIRRMNVTWGGDSLIECGLRLFETAAAGHYDYYHFISGVDMPLMTTDEMFEFVNLHKGKNYFSMEGKCDETCLDRIRYYYFFQNKIGKGLDNSTIIFQKLRGWALKIQKLLHFSRLKKTDLKFYKGEMWFSITDEMMQYIVSQRDLIMKTFSKGWCSDEMCWMTIAMNSPWADSVVNSCMRYIDWELGDPYIFQKQDYERIMASGKFFARKFSDSVDSEIVDLIYQGVLNN